jgi:hypothetical protein
MGIEGGEQLSRYLERVNQVAEAFANAKTAQTAKTEGQITQFSHSQELSAVLAALEARCPDGVDAVRWRQAVEDGRRFLATWGGQADALGWSASELFGLHPIHQTTAERVHPVRQTDADRSGPPRRRLQSPGGAQSRALADPADV